MDDDRPRELFRPRRIGWPFKIDPLNEADACYEIDKIFWETKSAS